MPILDLPTPAVVVDLDRLEAEPPFLAGSRHLGGARDSGPTSRPTRSSRSDARQIELGACGIASAKVSEAEVFATAGIRDIVIAYPVLGADKVERVARMAAGGDDHGRERRQRARRRGLSSAAVRHGARIGVQLEVDTGYNRVGFRPDETDRLESLARFVMSLPGLELEGITTHRGVGFEGAATMTPTEAGLAEGALLVEVAERLRARGIPIREVTAGGTITGRAVATVPGVTEVRAGTYVFNDLMQLGYGSATPADLALTILCTVVSHHGDRATIDGGSKTFAGDYRVEGSRPPTSRAIARARRSPGLRRSPLRGARDDHGTEQTPSRSARRSPGSRHMSARASTSPMRSTASGTDWSRWSGLSRRADDGRSASISRPTVLRPRTRHPLLRRRRWRHRSRRRRRGADEDRS